MSRRWISNDDGSKTCPDHGVTFRPPGSCLKCVPDPGPAPSAEPLVISFPPNCESDEGAWRRLTEDTAKLDEDLKFFRRVRRKLVSKSPTEKVTGGDGERVKSTLVLTDEIVSSLVSVGNLIVKLQDAKTKMMRAIVESATEHRRDQRNKQMLAAELKAQAASAVRGAAR